jgi:hypothetical protein
MFTSPPSEAQVVVPMVMELPNCFQTESTNTL